MVKVHSYIHMLRCCVSVSVGEEITISYIGDLCDSVLERQSLLRTGWDFTCKCPRCVVEAALPTRIKDLLANIQVQTTEDGSGTVLAKYRQDC